MFPPLRFPGAPVVGVCLTAFGLAAFPQPGGAAPADVDAQARSILTTNCVKCHGPTKQKGGLRFDSREGTMAKGDSGARAVTPGQPTASELIRRVTAKDAAVRMPPGERILTSSQIETLRKWIESGATWPRTGTEPATTGRTELTVTDDDRQHWSFRPLAKGELPVTPAGRVRTPIDRFIVAGLAAKGLTAVPPASARVLIRRATFDLTPR